MSVAVAPATLLDLAELSGSRTRTQWALARDLYTRGQFHAFRAGAELVLLAGFIPIAEGTAEMFFNPSSAAPRHILGIIRQGRLTIKAAPYRAIVAYGGSDAGKQFLQRLGFAFLAMSEFGEVWGYGRSSDGRSSQEEPAGAAGPGRGVAADQPGADCR